MTEREPTNTEKVIWWAKIGGVVAAIVGAIRHASELVVGGAATAAAAIGFEGVLFKRKQQSNAKT